MGCERMETDGMRYLDGEMSLQEKSEFEKHLDSCRACREAVAQMNRLGILTRGVVIKDPRDSFWDGYWKSIYRRIERKTAWIFILLGGILIILYELYRAVRDMGELTISKIAIILLLTGLAILLASVVRERIHQRKVDRYRDIKR